MKQGSGRFGSIAFVILLLMGAFTVVAPSEVAAAHSGDYFYSIDEGNATIIGYNGTGGVITIPSTLDGHPTVAIGAQAFEQKTSITSVTIPEGVVSIGVSAFSECTALAVVTMPESMQSIGDWAFYECNALNSVSIPGNTRNIGAVAFGFCAALTAIEVDASNQNYSSENGVLYDKARSTLIQFPGAKTGSFTIPDSVTSIGTYAFCRSVLASVTMGVEVSNIGDYGFFKYTNLTSVDLSNITSLGYGTFGYCTGLTSANIGSKVTNIGNYAFAECVNLTTIEVDEANPNYCSVAGVLYNKNGTTLITCPGGKVGAFSIPDGVMSIGTGAFYGDATIDSITIPGSVTSLGDYAFAWCAALTSVSIPDSVTAIGESAFVDCTALTTANVPNSVTSIGGSAFAYCPALTAIDVDPFNANYCSVEGVLYNKTMTALLQCPGAKAGPFDLPEGVLIIANYALAGCSALTSTTIGGNVTSIGNCAFDQCSNLTSISFRGAEAPIRIGSDWIRDTPTGIVGHAFVASDFPPPGSSFHGLLMGTIIPFVPGIPLLLSAAPGNAEIALAWTAPVSDGGSAIDHYIIFRDGVDIAHPTMRNATITGLINGQSYTFTVAAHNAVGTGPQSASNITTPVTIPGAPTGLTGVSGKAQVYLNWTAPASSGGSSITGYKVYLALAGGSQLLTSVNASTLGYAHTNGTVGTTYTYYVAATNAVGAGANSTQVSATPQSAIVDNTMLYAGVVIAIIAVIAIAVVLMRRKK